MIWLLASSHLAAWPGRSLCLVASVAVALASSVLLHALVSPDLPEDAALAAILVQNARSGATLPVRYTQAIENLDPVGHVIYIGSLGFFCKPGVIVSVNAYGGPGVGWLLTKEYGMAADDFSAWTKQLSGLLVGSRLAKQCGWSKGMRIQPESSMGGAPVEVRIVGLIPDSAQDPYLANVAIGHYEYANRLFGSAQRDMVGGIVAYPHDADKAAELAARIDALFATSDPPTHSRVSSETQSVLRKFGEIKVIVLWVVIALLGCTVLVVVSVMAYAAAHRRAIFGLLCTLGFRRAHAACAFALEFLIVLTTGAVLGVLAAWGLIATLSPRVSMIVGEFSLPPTTALLVGMVTLGMLACGMAIPLVTLCKSRPTDANRL